MRQKIVSKSKLSSTRICGECIPETLRIEFSYEGRKSFVSELAPKNEFCRKGVRHKYNFQDFSV